VISQPLFFAACVPRNKRSVFVFLKESSVGYRFSPLIFEEGGSLFSKHLSSGFFAALPPVRLVSPPFPVTRLPFGLCWFARFASPMKRPGGVSPTPAFLLATYFGTVQTHCAPYARRSAAYWRFSGSPPSLLPPASSRNIIFFETLVFWIAGTDAPHCQSSAAAALLCSKSGSLNRASFKRVLVHGYSFFAS